MLAGAAHTNSNSHDYKTPRIPNEASQPARDGGAGFRPPGIFHAQDFKGAGSQPSIQGAAAAAAVNAMNNRQDRYF